MIIAVLCVALLGFLVVGLGLVVSMTRGSTKTMYGYNIDPADRLYKAVRAHGNTTEYVPMLAVLVLTLGMLNPAPWMMWSMGLVTLSRYIFVFGIVLPPSMAQPSKLRFIGSLGTYLFGIALCIGLLMKVYPALMAMQQVQ